MRIEYRFICRLRNGLHARPASMLAEAARPFAAAMTIGKEGGEPVDLHSVLSIVGLDVKHGDACIIVAIGDDAEPAIRAMRELVETSLAEGDELPPMSEAAGEAVVALPIGLRRLGVAYAAGRGVSGGIGDGIAVLVDGLTLPPAARAARGQSADAELQAVRSAIRAVADDLLRRADGARGMEGELLRAHAGIAADPALAEGVEAGIRAGATAAQSVVAAAESFAARLRGCQSQYIRDRALDVQDVAMQLLERLLGPGAAAVQVSLAVESVVLAEALTANQLLRMDRRLLRGLVLGRVGVTSHTVILARSLRIPTLIDVPNAARAAAPASRLVVDGDGGFVITQVTDSVERYYQRERRTQQRWRERLAPIARGHATTADGMALEVGANASTADEVAAAVEHGADGVGLLRTELLFLDRDTPPTEEEQLDAYRAVVEAAGGRAVIIRTFDIGGDKPAAYLSMPREENPFLGVRGLRLYEKHEGMLRTQLRAILRASATGPVKVMAPMVATPAEAAWFREEVRAAQSDLRGQSILFDERLPIGIMIEIPAAAMVMDQLCDEVDFFSLGTNDLCQYWMAVDRGNAGVAGLYKPRQPSFLRLLRTIVDGARARKKWIGVCGEMAGDRLNLPLMIGLGVDEISVAPGAVLGLKTLVRQAEAARCRELLDDACSRRTPREVEELLASASWRAASPQRITEPDLIDLDSDAATKEEAIKDAADLLYIAGRTERPRAVEEAAWAREATYSTGLGFGFAVPHCKTGAVGGPSLAVMRLRSPVDWGSMDGEPVRMVLLLAIPASDTTGAHMKVFAKLARRLMHEEFRAGLMGTAEASAVETYLKAELGTD
jgi:fructose-specific PTS system IIA-like component